MADKTFKSGNKEVWSDDDIKRLQQICGLLVGAFEMLNGPTQDRYRQNVDGLIKNNTVLKIFKDIPAATGQAMETLEKTQQEIRNQAEVLISLVKNHKTENINLNKLNKTDLDELNNIVKEIENLENIQQDQTSRPNVIR